MHGKVMYRVVETKMIPATKEALMQFSHKELRYYAKSLGIEHGRDKADTVQNLLLSGKATILAQLGD